MEQKQDTVSLKAKLWLCAAFATCTIPVAVPCLYYAYLTTDLLISSKWTDWLSIFPFYDAVNEQFTPWEAQHIYSAYLISLIAGLIYIPTAYTLFSRFLKYARQKTPSIFDDIKHDPLKMREELENRRKIWLTLVPLCALASLVFFQMAITYDQMAPQTPITQYVLIVLPAISCVTLAWALFLSKALQGSFKLIFLLKKHDK